MTNNIQDEMKDYNNIAYDKNLRERLEELHRLLGAEVTDVADQAMKHGIGFVPGAEGVMKIMSRLASDLSVALLDARGDNELNVEENKNFNEIKKLAGTLGNLQYKLNEVIKKIKLINKQMEELRELSFDFGDDISNAQADFRKARAHINDLGYVSDDPRLASLFELNS
jgi:hypothetical protein